MKKIRTNEEWLKLIQDFQNSGSSCRQWCIKNNIPNSTFHKVLKRLNINQGNSYNDNEVVELPIAEEIPPAVLVETKDNSSPAVVFSYKGYSIEINNHAEKELLQNVFGFKPVRKSRQNHCVLCYVWQYHSPEHHN